MDIGIWDLERSDHRGISLPTGRQAQLARASRRKVGRVIWFESDLLHIGKIGEIFSTENGEKLLTGRVSKVLTKGVFALAKGQGPKANSQLSQCFYLVRLMRNSHSERTIQGKIGAKTFIDMLMKE